MMRPEKASELGANRSGDMSVTFVYEDRDHETAIRYVAEELLLRVGIPFRLAGYDEATDDAQPVISYGRALPSPCPPESVPWLHIWEGDFWKGTRGRAYPFPETPLRTFDDVPALYCGQRSCEKEPGQRPPDAELKCDVVASAFFLLTRCEETASQARDEHDRFPASASFSLKQDILNRPLVDEYAACLFRQLSGIADIPPRRSPWGRHPYAVCLTHDVDQIALFRSIRQMLAATRLSLRYKPSAAWRVPRDFMSCLLGKRSDPFATFEDLVALEKSVGARGTYFFLSGRGKDAARRYSLSAVADTIALLQHAGHEIGLHGSYEAYADALLLEEERERLESACHTRVVSIRNHYLRFKLPDTWRAQHDAELETDSTLSFANHEGFRAGTCMPFSSFDAASGVCLGVTEVPLTIMEGTLYRYRKLRAPRVSAHIDQMTDTIRAVGGAFVLLWHNSSLYDPLHPQSKQVLRAAMERFAADGALMIPMKEIAALWHDHRKELRCESS